MASGTLGKIPGGLIGQEAISFLKKIFLFCLENRMHVDIKIILFIQLRINVCWSLIEYIVMNTHCCANPLINVLLLRIYQAYVSIYEHQRQKFFIYI